MSGYSLVTGVTRLAILGAQSWVQTVFYGGALILAVAFAQLSKGRKSQEIISRARVVQLCVPACAVAGSPPVS